MLCAAWCGSPRLTLKTSSQEEPDRIQSEALMEIGQAENDGFLQRPAHVLQVVEARVEYRRRRRAFHEFAVSRAGTESTHAGFSQTTKFSFSKIISIMLFS